VGITAVPWCGRTAACPVQTRVSVVAAGRLAWRPWRLRSAPPALADRGDLSPERHCVGPRGVPSGGARFRRRSFRPWRRSRPYRPRDARSQPVLARAAL